MIFPAATMTVTKIADEVLRGSLDALKVKQQSHF